jgi:outer membrane immunogenic protein
MENSMRFSFHMLAGTAALLIGTQALGADFPVLRGSQIDLPPPQHTNTSSGPNWDGLYFGGFGGFSSMNSDFTRVASVYSAQAFNGLALATQGNTLLKLGKSGDDKIAFGGFIGYNMMFDDIMFGLEADYSKVKFRTTDAATITATYANLIASTIPTSAAWESAGTQTDLTVTGRTRAEINDYGVLKARLGYAWGNLMPFMTAGVAVGRYKTDNNVSQVNTYYNLGQAYNTVNILGVQTRTTATGPSGRVLPPIFTGTSNAGRPKSGYAAGVALGLGVDALITDNILIRAEYQRVFFNQVTSTNITLDQARVGAAVKF